MTEGMSLAVWEWKRNALPWQWWRVKWRAPAAGWIGLDKGMHCMLCMHPVQSWVVPLQHASVASTAQTRLGACRDCRWWTPDTFPLPVAEHWMHTGWRMQEWLSTGNRLHGCGYTVKGYKNAVQSIGYAAAYPLNPPLQAIAYTRYSIYAVACKNHNGNNTLCGKLRHVWTGRPKLNDATLLLSALNCVIFNSKKQIKQVGVCKEVKCSLVLPTSKTIWIFVYRKLKILIINTLSYVKYIKSKLKQNCCNAGTVLSFVAPSGEQELTKS